LAGVAERLRHEASSIWDRIFEHPFLQELAEGSLPMRKFKFFVEEDYFFLVELCRVLGLAVAKAGDVDALAWYGRVLNATATSEMDALLRLGREAGVVWDDVIARGPAPTNKAYTQFLLSTAYQGGETEILAAILPCYWSYLEIAERVIKSPNILKTALYHSWCQSYLSEPYRELVRWLCGRIDKLSPPLERVAPVFMQASRYEHQFWTMAYEEERWRI